MKRVIVVTVRVSVPIGLLHNLRPLDPTTIAAQIGLAAAEDSAVYTIMTFFPLYPCYSTLIMPASFGHNSTGNEVTCFSAIPSS